MNIVEKGTIEPINIMAFNFSSLPLINKTDIKVQIRRVSDGYYLDWDDFNFKTGASVVQLLNPLSEVSSLYSPGEYQGFFNTGSIVNSVDNDVYEIMVRQDGSFDASNLPQTGEIKVGHWVDQLISADTVVLQSYSFDPVSNWMTAMSWVEKGSLVIIDPTNCQFKLYNSEGVEIFDETDDSPDAQGFFKIVKATSLTRNNSYYGLAKITLASGDIYRVVKEFSQLAMANHAITMF